MTILLFVAPEHLEGGHLSGIPIALRESGYRGRLIVPAFSLGENSRVTDSQSGIEVVEVLSGASQPISAMDLRNVDQFLRTNPAARTVFSRLIKMLNRYDFTGTFRTLDRELIVYESALRTISFLSFTAPRAVVFLTTPHLFGDYLLFEAAKFLHLPTLFFQPVPLSAAMIPFSDLGVQIQPELPIGLMPGVGQQVIRRAEKRLRALLEGSSPPYMERQAQSAGRSRSLPGRVRAIRAGLRGLFSPQFAEAVDFSGLKSSSTPARNALGIYLNWSIIRELRLRAQVRKNPRMPRKFAFFALHYEPERTSLPEGLPIEFQLEAIFLARAIVPMDTALVIKEHPSQVSPSLRGFLGRSPGFYAMVAKLPNTILLSPAEETGQLFKNAEAVFTLSGTIGIEAAAAGVPCGYFGLPWWEGAPGTKRIDENATWEELMDTPPSSAEAIERFVTEKIARDCIPGIAGEDLRSYVARNGELGGEVIEEMCKATAREIVALVGV